MPRPVKRTGDNEGTVEDLIKNYKRLVILGLTLTVVPLALAQTDLRLPWPNGAEIPTALIQLVALIVTFHFLSSRTVIAARRSVFVSSAVLTISCLLYVCLLLGFTYTGQDGKREPRGFFCSPIALVEYASQCPFLGTNELKRVENAATNLWTERSIDAVKGTLFLTWLLSFIALPAMATGFFVAQAKKQAE